jgi:hypothetical protein
MADFLGTMAWILHFDLRMVGKLCSLLGASHAQMIFALLIIANGTSLFADTVQNCAGRIAKLESAHSELKHLDYGWAKIIGLTILNRFKDKNVLFVGVGRSPAPIIAYLQLMLGRNSAFNFPFSRNYSLHKTELSKFDSQINSHFQKYFTLERLKDDRTLVLIDYTLSGMSIDTATRATAYYLDQNNLTNRVHRFALLGDCAPDSSAPADYASIPCSMDEHLWRKTFSELAEVPSFHITEGEFSHIDRKERLKRYAALKAWLFFNIISDDDSRVAPTILSMQEKFRRMSPWGQRPVYYEEPKIGATPKEILKLRSD